MNTVFLCLFLVELNAVFGAMEGYDGVVWCTMTFFLSLGWYSMTKETDHGVVGFELICYFPCGCLMMFGLRSHSFHAAFKLNSCRLKNVFCELMHSIRNKITGNKCQTDHSRTEVVFVLESVLVMSSDSCPPCSSHIPSTHDEKTKMF